MHLWDLTEFKVVLYLDSDVLVLRPINEIFTYMRKLAAIEAVAIARRCGASSGGDRLVRDTGWGGDTSRYHTKPKK